MVRELPGIIICVAFIAGFVYLMNHIADPKFNGDANFYSAIAAGVLVFAVLMVYWDRIFRWSD